jgi:hypothetical protein
MLGGSLWPALQLTLDEEGSRVGFRGGFLPELPPIGSPAGVLLALKEYHRLLSGLKPETWH